jgi:hypothetical protein
MRANGFVQISTPKWFDERGMGGGRGGGEMSLVFPFLLTLDWTRKFSWWKCELYAKKALERILGKYNFMLYLFFLCRDTIRLRSAQSTSIRHTYKDHLIILVAFTLASSFLCIECLHQTTREGWPLLVVETEATGDSKSKNERG